MAENNLFFSEFIDFIYFLFFWSSEFGSYSYLIVEVVNLQLVASAAVGEVQAAVLLSAEQLRVLMLLPRRRRTLGKYTQRRFTVNSQKASFHIFKIQKQNIWSRTKNINVKCCQAGRLGAF